MAGHDLTVRFWGVRGSHPVPGKTTLRYGGNTSCIEILARDRVIILDAGTGIINLGNELMQRFNGHVNRSEITLLISHTHHDHIQGLPFFQPAFHPNFRINVFGPKSLSSDLADILEESMSPQYSPIEMEDLSAEIDIRNITDKQLLLFSETSHRPTLVRGYDFSRSAGDEIVIRTMRSYGHPKVGVFIFKIEVNGYCIVYATDTEGYVGGDVRLTEFARGAHLLIHDAQYSQKEYLDPGFPKQGFGHSTNEMAAHLAQSAGVDNLVLFHHDPANDDDAIDRIVERAKEIFPKTEAGTEGAVYQF